MSLFFIIIRNIGFKGCPLPNLFTFLIQNAFLFSGPLNFILYFFIYMSIILYIS